MTPDQIIADLRAQIVHLELENTGLRNQLWTTTKTLHSHDPFEGEDA